MAVMIGTEEELGSNGKRVCPRVYPLVLITAQHDLPGKIVPFFYNKKLKQN
jgi:hypothetical protein